MTVPFDDHYFYGELNSLYLIGSVLQKFERTREVCFYLDDYYFWSHWKHPIYLQSQEIYLKAIRFLFEVFCLVNAGYTFLYKGHVQFAARKWWARRGGYHNHTTLFLVTFSKVTSGIASLVRFVASKTLCSWIALSSIFSTFWTHFEKYVIT